MYNEQSIAIAKSGSAFLNPRAKASREISVALAKVVYKGGAVLDATAATGIRGMQYASALAASKVVMLEINPSVYKDLTRNIAYNKKPGKHIGRNVKALNLSFQEFANTTRDRFEIIDLDPFGSAAPYIFDAMKIVSDSSYFFVTTTDSAVLCGAHKNACLKLYDAVPMHNEFCHEAGIRILLGYIARIAAQFNYGIVPVLSLYYAHYMRVFVRLEHGAGKALASLSELGYAHYCERCGNRGFEKGSLPKRERCPLCGSEMAYAGRMWMGSITDNKTAREARSALAKDASKEAKTLLETIVGEIDVPFYYSIPKLTKKLGISSISISELVKEVGKIGKVSRTHFDHSAIKTDINYERLRIIAESLSKGRP
ncbi:MAG: hypothetical protein QXK65_01525 [Candidatus Micrarchaeaceae archaeon]